jgi:nicotinate-nucleotide adenylyltransferase
MKAQPRSRTGILGGTFDPVHLGHLLIAEQARDQLNLDAVLFVPAGRPPHKSSLGITDASTRCEMVDLAVVGNPAFQLSTSDLDLAEPSYTFELLERMAADRQHGQLFFIMGEDSLNEFGSWVNPRRIIELATLAVARRPLLPSATRSVPDVPGLDRRLEWIVSPQCDISSSDIRQRVQTGETIRYMVPDAVRVYIETNDVYRGQDRAGAEGVLPNT